MLTAANTKYSSQLPKATLCPCVLPQDSHLATIEQHAVSICCNPAAYEWQNTTFVEHYSTEQRSCVHETISEGVMVYVGYVVPYRNGFQLAQR